MNKQLKKLNEQIANLQTQKNEVFKKTQAELKAKYEKIFDFGHHKGSFEIRPCGGNLETIGFDNVALNKPSRNELFTVNINHSYPSKEYTLSLGYYASIANNSTEYKRLQLLGTVAAIVNGNEKTILNTYKTVTKKYFAESNSLRDQVWSLEGKRSTIFNSIKENAFNAVVAKAEADFIELPSFDHWRHAEIKVGGGLKVYNPHKLKINSYLNKSKKTANVTVLSISDQYNHDTNQYEKVQRSETYPKVRLEWLKTHFNDLARKSIQKQTNTETA